MAFSLFGKKTTPPAGKGQTPQEKSRGNDTLSLEGASGNGGPIEVQEVSQQMPAVVEQAAMLYSIEQSEAACNALEAAVRTEDLDGYVVRAWGMLFELYQMLGRQQDFERVAIDYAARFETSPPTWVRDLAKEAAAAPAPSKVGTSLSGMVDAKAEATLKPLLRLAEKNPSVRLDIGRVTDADDAGCAAIREALATLKKARKECVLVGADKLAAILAPKVAMGERQNEQIWLLLLDLYQRLAQQEPFEELAVNYAVTFEVSPPSWEPVPASAARAGEAGAEALAEAEPEDEDAAWCTLEGSITAASPSPFTSIRARAESSNDVIVDVSRLRHMDFVAATNLMNLATSLLAGQKRLRLVKASHLVTALWEVIGLDRVAVIVTRKF